MPFSSSSISELEAQTSQERYDYLVQQALTLQQIWIVIDDQGSVLLTCDDEECVPIWPHEEAAKNWIQGDWSDCKTHSISLTDWQAKWTKGLREDDLKVAVFPNQDVEAIIVTSESFDDDLISAKA